MAQTHPVLSAILEDPAADEPRAVYADWLLSKDDPRGQFISDQLRLASLDALAPEMPELLGRSRRLQAAHAQAWLSPSLAEPQDDVPLAPYHNVLFERGFVARLAFEQSELETLWPRICAQEPVRGLELRVHSAVDLRSFAGAGELRNLKVNPTEWVTATSLGHIMNWGLDRVETLDMSKCDLGPTGARLLSGLSTDLGQYFDDWTEPPPFREGQLKALKLHGCNLSDEGLLTLLSAPAIKGIHQLDVSQNKCTGVQALEALAGSDQLNQLSSLSIAGNKPWGAHVGLLSNMAQSLTSLALPQSTEPQAFSRLFSKTTSRLRHLELKSAKLLFTNHEVVWPRIMALTHLDISTCRLADAGFVHLLEQPCAGSLMTLKAGGNSLSDKAVFALCASTLKRLVTLDLSSNKLTDASLEALAEWPGLPQITHLRLRNNRKLTERGWKALVDASGFSPVALDVGKAADEQALKERFGSALQEWT